VTASIRLDKADGSSLSVAEMLEALAILEEHGIKVADVVRVPSEGPPDDD
jgi:hypothetical protein